MPKTPVTWSAGDEALLKELTDRKIEFAETYRVPLFDLIIKDFPSQGGQGVNARLVSGAVPICDWLIKNADTIRDLLLPFDSGVRPANAEKQS